MRLPNRRRRGYIMLATAVSLAVLIGMLGLAVDLGRVYITKSEAQAFADFAAMAAARELNGKIAGLDAARAAVTSSTNGWNFGTQAFAANRTTVEFAASVNGPWEATPPNPPVGYRMVRVSVFPDLPLSFMPALGAATTQRVRANAVAGQVPQQFPAGGYLPFTPFALSISDPTGNFGMTIGQEYAFLWPGNATKNNSCAGNRVSWPLYNFSDNSSTAGSDRGYFELQAASAIRDAIQGLRQTSPLDVGDVIGLTNGQKQAMQDALTTRASYDTDSTNYQPTPGTAPDYDGNGMRLVVMPVNSGALTNPPNVVQGFAAFLLPMSYPNGGNKTWCAIYMGSRVDGGGVSSTVGAGSYVVRLVQ